MSTMETMSLFANDQAHADRCAAIDKLHEATAIYTAEVVVDSLLERLRWPSPDRRLADSSAGNGEFLCRALRKLFQHHKPSSKELLDIMEGWEIHPFACAQARARVAAVLVDCGWSASDAAHVAEAMVRNADFLTEGPVGPKYHCIVGNPPYLRWVNVPKILRDEYEEHVPGYAASDMLHSFLDRLAKTVFDDGEICLVTSDRWLFSDSASKLRGVLGERLSIKHLERLDAKTTFYRPKIRRAGTPPRIHPISIVLARQEGRPLTFEPIFPGVDTERYSPYPTLETVAHVRIAPWLGSPGVFFVTAEEARASKLPPEVLVPAVDTDDIDGDKLGEPKRFAILTRPDEPPCDAVMAHLERMMPTMAPRGRRGKFWMPPESFHRMDLTKPSLLVPRIATRPKAVWVPPGYLPINHNLSIVNGGQQTLEDIERALASDLATDWVRDHAAPLENGYFSLTTKLLRKLPIDLSRGSE